MEDNNLNLMSLYLSDIQKFDLLSKEEEYELLKRIREHDDEQARQLLILLPVMLLMTYIFGVEGMMFATPVSDVISLVLCLFFFKRELHDIHMKEELVLSK